MRTEAENLYFFALKYGENSGRRKADRGDNKMTEKQFWMKLDQLLSIKNSRVLASLKAARLIQQACDEGLPVLVSGQYGNAEYRELNPGDRYFVCYTSRKQAEADRGNRGMWSKCPAVELQQAIEDDASPYKGYLFNVHTDKYIIIPFDIATDERDNLDALISFEEDQTEFNALRDLTKKLKEDFEKNPDNEMAEQFKPLIERGETLLRERERMLRGESECL